MVELDVSLSPLGKEGREHQRQQVPKRESSSLEGQQDVMKCYEHMLIFWGVKVGFQLKFLMTL